MAENIPGRFHHHRYRQLAYFHVAIDHAPERDLMLLISLTVPLWPFSKFDSLCLPQVEPDRRLRRFQRLLQDLSRFLMSLAPAARCDRKVVGVLVRLAPGIVNLVNLWASTGDGLAIRKAEDWVIINAPNVVQQTLVFVPVPSKVLAVSIEQDRLISRTKQEDSTFLTFTFD